MLNEPEYVEISTSMYDCGECGFSFLDWVIIYPDKPFRDEWLACPNCGWDDIDEEANEDVPNDSLLTQEEWYQTRYREKR